MAEMGYGYGGHHILPYGERYTVEFSSVNQLFTTVTFKQEAPWNVGLSDNEISRLASRLSDLYKNHSGIKIVSRAVRRRYEVTSDNIIVGYTLTQNALEDIAAVLLAKYGLKWKRLYEAYSVEFNPLNNFSLTKQDSGTISDDRNIETNDNLSHGKTTTTNLTHGHVITNSGNDVTRYNSQTTDTFDEQTQNQNNYDGFNSSSSVPVNDSTSTRKTLNDGNKTSRTGTDTLENGLIQTNSGIDTTNETNGGTDRRSIDTTDGNIRTLNTQEVRSGYISSPSRELEQFVQFYLRTFFEEVFRDLDSELTLKVF